MPRLFHVTASHNRRSIELYGLDWMRMGRMLGVAGSSRPEVDGVFLCRDESEVDFFCGMDANAGPVDVWAVDAIRDADLVQAPEGFVYLTRPIPPERLTLSQSMRPAQPHANGDKTSTAYQSEPPRLFWRLGLVDRPQAEGRC